MSNYSEYDQFLKDAEKDDRIGKHTFVIDSKLVDAWADGTPRYKFRGRLLTAGGAKTDMTLSPPPPVEQLAGITGGRKKGIALSITNLKALASYAKDLDSLDVGDELSVETAKDGDFVRVRRILKPGETTGGTAATDRVPGF